MYNYSLYNVIIMYTRRKGTFEKHFWIIRFGINVLFNNKNTIFKNYNIKCDESVWMQNIIKLKK